MEKSGQHSLGGSMGFGIPGSARRSPPPSNAGRDRRAEIPRKVARALRWAGRRLRRRRRGILIGVGVSALVLTWVIPAGSVEGPRYLHAKYPVAAGAPCLPQYFGMGPQASPPEGALTDQRLDACSGNRLARAIRPGEILTWGHLEVNNLADELPRGTRAYGVETPHLKYLSGDRVDVFLRPQSPALLPGLLLEGVRVLRSTNRDRKTLLALKPDEVALLENAGRRGTLTLVLRNPKERVRSRRPKARRAKIAIPVWTEDS